MAVGMPTKNGISPSRNHSCLIIILFSRHDDDEPDEYVHGSFVVDDDAEISYTTSFSD